MKKPLGTKTLMAMVDLHLPLWGGGGPKVSFGTSMGANNENGEVTEAAPTSLTVRRKIR